MTFELLEEEEEELKAEPLDEIDDSPETEQEFLQRVRQQHPQVIDRVYDILQIYKDYIEAVNAFELMLFARREAALRPGIELMKTLGHKIEHLLSEPLDFSSSLCDLETLALVRAQFEDKHPYLANLGTASLFLPPGRLRNTINFGPLDSLLKRLDGEYVKMCDSPDYQPSIPEAINFFGFELNPDEFEDEHALYKSWYGHYLGLYLRDQNLEMPYITDRWIAVKDIRDLSNVFRLASFCTMLGDLRKKRTENPVQETYKELERCKRAIANYLEAELWMPCCEETDLITSD